MKNTSRKMHLGAFLPAPGHHVAAWRHPNTPPNGGLHIAHYTRLAQTAERGLFDLMFLSDGAGIRTHYANADELSRWGRVVQFEPLTLLSALSGVTSRLGLVATSSTTYNEPFHLARMFSSLDHLSDGRAGWNIVTSVTDAEAQNFNLERQPSHQHRYERAEEFVRVVTGLWDSWDDDAFLFDKESGRYFDPDKLHMLNHKGRFFSVRGPLNLSRSPQGYPVLVQAGSSPTGMAFASRWAEVVFTAQQTLAQGQAFYSDLKKQVSDVGRDPDSAVVMPGVFIVVAKTRAEAEDKYELLQDRIDPVVGLGLLTGLIGDVDLTGYPLDGPLPVLPETEGSTSRQRLVYEQARSEKLTIRELIRKVAGGRGHGMVIGTPSDVADHLEEWFRSGAADGFNVMPPQLPDGLEDIVDLVVPELQRRGLFRTEYLGRTLRDHLGLTRPVLSESMGLVTAKP